MDPARVPGSQQDARRGLAKESEFEAIRRAKVHTRADFAGAAFAQRDCEAAIVEIVRGFG